MAQQTVVPVGGEEGECGIAETKMVRPAVLLEPAHHTVTHWSIHAEGCRLLAFIRVRH